MTNQVVETEINMMEWLSQSGLSVKLFCLALEIDKSYLYKIMKGDCVPSKQLMTKIKKLTKGKIDIPEKLKK